MLRRMRGRTATVGSVSLPRQFVRMDPVNSSEYWPVKRSLRGAALVPQAVALAREGVRMVRSALARTDAAIHGGRKPGPVTRGLTGLMSAGIASRGDE